MSTINNIAHHYKGIYEEDVYDEFSVDEKSLVLEDHLTAVCNHLAETQKLLCGKTIDVEYLLNVVGSYLLGIQEGQLEEGVTEPPSKLFETSLYPTLENMGEVTKEVDNDESDDSGTLGEDVT